MSQWRAPLLIIIATFTALAAVGIADTDPATRRARPPQQLAGTSFLDTAQASIRLAAMECPYDMPECTATARDRYRKWQRGVYGSTPADRQVRYTRKIRRQIINMAARIFHNNNPGKPFYPRAKWRRFVQRDRCVGDTYIATRDGRLRYSRFCGRPFYNHPEWGTARKWVKWIDLCAGEIGLAVLGTRGLGAARRSTLVAGTGWFCTWKNTPAARR